MEKQEFFTLWNVSKAIGVSYKTLVSQVKIGVLQPERLVIKGSSRRQWVWRDHSGLFDILLVKGLSKLYDRLEGYRLRAILNGVDKSGSRPVYVGFDGLVVDTVPEDTCYIVIHPERLKYAATQFLPDMIRLGNRRKVTIPKTPKRDLLPLRQSVKRAEGIRLKHKRPRGRAKRDE